MTTGIKLTKAETELYDRQIRLWGIESQEKLKEANILLIGVKGLGSEIAKNILLCGTNSLTIIDDDLVTEEEISKNLLLDRGCIGKKVAEAILMKAQALNPLVKIIIDSQSISNKSSDYFKKFTIVVATDLTLKEIIKIDGICRDNNVKFICGSVFGMFGYAILDLNTHEFLEEKISFPSKKRSYDGKTLQSLEKTVTKVQCTLHYPKIEDIFELNPSKCKFKKKNVLFFLMKVLLEFCDKCRRNPEIDNRETDLKKLKEIQQVIIDEYQVLPDKLTQDLLDLTFGKASPVCSILGGVIAQEVIKAISCKEVPIYNMFLLDPFTLAGSEEIVCN